MMEPEVPSSGATPPPPPPGGGAEAVGPLPWEARAERGAVAALFETLKLLVLSPADAYQRARKQGDYLSPLGYAVIVGWVMAVVGQLWGLLFQTSWIALLPIEAKEDLAAMAASSLIGFVLTLVLAPVFVLIGLFVWSAIVHLFLMLVGGTRSSTAGFEGTVRAISYATTAQVANVVPIAGGLLAMVWGLVLDVIGLAKLHDTTNGKAAAAVLIPLAICCGCGIGVFLLCGAAIAAAIAAAGS